MTDEKDSPSTPPVVTEETEDVDLESWLAMERTRTKNAGLNSLALTRRCVKVFDRKIDALAAAGAIKERPERLAFPEEPVTVREIPGTPARAVGSPDAESKPLDPGYSSAIFPSEQPDKPETD